ncbi:MAG: hypothetical protein NXY57DRAFT_966648 [Lentinula lateritia]|nr:MAG: hypothetical protein NXY57DRAFT_966648 [Lentinula lateritia]
MFLSMFLFVQLLSISAYALPTNISALDERGFLDKLTGNDIVIGYGFVDQNQALSECNPFRTVRAIPAAEKEILEGVYHTSSLDLRPDGLPSNYWEQMINCFRSGQWYALVTLYLYGISKTASKTILFSEYSYSDGKIGYQMLIPPNIWRSRTIIASVSQDGEQIVSVKRPGVISLVSRKKSNRFDFANQNFPPLATGYDTSDTYY